jgi:hypothetical protein
MPEAIELDRGIFDAVCPSLPQHKASDGGGARYELVRRVDYNMILRLRLSFIFNSLDYCLTFSYQFGFHWP